jgi:hypothetical protein
MSKRLEEIAYHFRDGILWLAYRYSGAGKEEIVYTQGFNTEGKTGGPLYDLISKILAVDHFDRKTLFPRFIGCDQVYLDATTPEGIKAVMLGFFASIDLDVREVDAPIQTYDEISARWSGPLGGPLSNELPGGIRVFSILEAGITQKVTS